MHTLMATFVVRLLRFIGLNFVPNVLTIDLETSGLDPFHDEILIIGYSIDGAAVQQVKVYEGEEPDEIFKTTLNADSVIKRGHNVHFDLLCLAVNGYAVAGPIDDTRILAYLENPEQNLGLKDLVEKKLRRHVVRMEDFGTKRLSEKVFKRHPELTSKLIKCGQYWVSKKTLCRYNINDVENCDALAKVLVPTQWYKRVEQPLAGILYNLEHRGMQLDTIYLMTLEEHYGAQIEQKLRLLMDLTGIKGFNPNSPLQVKKAFAERGRLLESTDKHTLKLLAWQNDTFATELLRYRTLTKLLSTYIRPLLDQSDEHGRIHGYFNQAGRETTTSDINGPATGRLSSSNPNLQNIPSRSEEGKAIRKAFIAPQGQLLICSDLKQIEPRLIAHYSQSQKLITAYRENQDTHALMAADIFTKPVNEITKMERFIGKTGWLQIVYGSGWKRLKYMIELNSEEKVSYDDLFYQKVKDNFWAGNRDIKLWREKLIAQARAVGHIITIGGRCIKIPGLSSKNPTERFDAERKVVNYQIQGSAADIMKMVLVNLDRNLYNFRYGPQHAKIIASVHDEVLVECTDWCAGALQRIVHATMCGSVNLTNVEIDAETKLIYNWADK